MSAGFVGLWGVQNYFDDWYPAVSSNMAMENFP